MSEDTAKQNVRDDEIDLLDLFRRIGRTFSRWANSIGKGILISVIFMLRRWIPLGTSVLAGIGLAWVMTKTSDSYYSADLVLRANVQPTDALISHINRLHTFCIEGNKENLAQSLGIKTDQTKNILDIQAFWIIDNGADGIPDYVDYSDKHNVYDTVNIRMKDRFNIRVKIIQPQELTNVKNGLIKFINSESLFQQRNAIRLRQNEEIVSRLKTDIDQLDNLQKYKFFEETKNYSKAGGQMVFLQEQKTQLLYPDIYNLYYRKQNIEQEQDLYRDIVTVLSEFTIPFQRINSGIFYVKTIVPLFFAVTLILLIALAKKKKIREVYNRYQ
ncbi:MAG TPA: hypothetical protein VHO50_13695 [Bacteroidales bacterium]|nr:hypothetical protein [Bacteroidales bacterium]